MTAPPPENQIAPGVSRSDEVNGEIRQKPFTSPQSETQAPVNKAGPWLVNSTWRVAFDERQWLLQVRQGERWRDRSFCVTRRGLLRCIAAYCGPADTGAIAAFPDWHPDRSAATKRLLPGPLPVEGAS